MIEEILYPQDAMLGYIKDDPVRPHIPAEIRIQGNKRVFYLSDPHTHEVQAIVCLAFTDQVAKTELELSRFMSRDSASVCMFYTIWSYTPGAGRKLALEMIRYIKDHFPEIKRVVTLSPKTEMARRFHLKNGAFELQENAETINFEYPLDK